MKVIPVIYVFINIVPKILIKHIHGDLLVTGKLVINTVNHVHAVTSIKQLSVLKGHLFLVLSLEISYE